jgi:hypothetical protein
VLAMRSLLQALHRDERICLAVIPLLYNVMLLFGLLPFLLGIPTMLWAVATAIRYLERPTIGRGALLAGLAACLFYLHVFPFALFVVAFVAMFPWKRPEAWIVAGTPTVPAIGLVVWWTLLTPEGHLARGALIHPDRPSLLTPLQKVKDAYNWVGDVYRDLSDEAIYAALAAVLFLSVLLAWRERTTPSRIWPYALVPFACLVMTFLAGEQHGHIWLIWQRFPILLLITALPLARVPQGRRGVAVTVGLGLVGLVATVSACAHNLRFEKDDVRDFDGALAAMDPRKHVVGLIYDRWSSVVFREPFLHFVSYYQLEKGGVVEYTFAGYPHWPFTFKPDRMPPQGAPTRLNWEWHPEDVTMAELYPYFDYVLTRGEGFSPPPGTFHLKWSGERWRVWEQELPTR